MEERSLSLLEYDKIREELTQLAYTALGQRLCQHLLPSSDFHQVEERLAETEDAVSVLLQKAEPPLQGGEDLSEIFARSRNGSSMNAPQLLAVARFLRTVHRLIAFVPVDATRDNRLWTCLASLEKVEALEKRLSKAILSEDEIADAASPELTHIRQQLRRAQAQVRNILERLMKAHSKALQEQLITQRGNRYVLPVKESHRSALPGLVHDTSGSGQTLFVEPLEVVEANNKIREWQAEEREEIARILERLTEETMAEADRILYNQDLVARIDFMVAKARLALRYKALKPKLSQKDELHFIQARHPLLREKAVPISFHLGGADRTLLITGPNTGGKTVALKTCGLLSLMAMAGLLVPVAEGSQLSVFQDVLVDIGDDQSIEANLSTFSSHMKHLIEMTEKAHAGCLILSDELGSGTDPLEGAALAQAILIAWKQAGALTMATTHYRELKRYALETDGVLNACCELDSESLQPTYRILMGAVGVSHAFAISERLGLPHALIQEAKSLLSEEDRQFEDFLQKLTLERQQLAKELEEAEKACREAKQAKEEAQRLEEELRSKKNTFLEKARAQAREKYADGLAEVDRLLKELQSLRVEAVHEREKSAKRARRRLGEQFHDLEAEIGADTLGRLREGEVMEDLRLGASYYAPVLGLSGKLIDGPDAKGMYRMATGSMTISVPAEGLRPLDEQPKEKTGNLQQKSAYYREKNRHAGPGVGNAHAENKALPLELMLLGETTADAVVHLDQHIDQAQVVGIHEVRIVHGKGTGALRQAVHAFLKRDKRVKEFHLAAYGEGDSGVTIATLKHR